MNNEYRTRNIEPQKFKFIIRLLAAAFFIHYSLFSIQYSFAQSGKIDSLLSLLKTAKEDTNKVNALNALAQELKYNNPDTSIILDNQALSIAEKLNWKKGIAKSLGQLGVYNYLKDNYPKALDYYFRALKLDEELGRKSGIAINLGNIGIVYDEQADYPKALDYYFRALKIGEELGNKNRIAIQLGNIGLVYRNQGDYPKALDYYFRALKMNEELERKSGIAANLGNIGGVYNDQADYTKVHQVERDSFLNMALDYYFKALKIAEELGNKSLIAINLGNIGALYTETGKFGEAEDYLKKSLAIAEEIGSLDYIKEANQNLSQLYDTTGRYKLAFAHYKKYITARDSITNDENTKTQTRTEMNYEFEKKEAATKAEQDKKDAVAAEESKKQKIIRNSIAGGLGVVLLFSLVVYRQRNRIAKEKKRSDELLLNILPSETAEELKLTGHAEPKQFDRVTVLFTDFKGFTQIAENMNANELVGELNFLFSKFDEIISKYPIEKIKTIGDAYMCAGGLPVANTTNAMDVVLAALEIQAFCQTHSSPLLTGGDGGGPRIGIHTGPIVAGIVGIKKFAYDIWGDTVNTASRMESSGEAGKVNISGSTYQLVKDKIKCTYRGKVQAKNKGEIEMYFVDKI